MKCKGCGANFPSRELTCPYCGRENHRGLSWFSHRQAAEEAYQQALAQSGVSLRRIAANRIVNRILFGIIALFLLTVLLVFLYFFAAEGLSRLSVALRQDAIYEYLDQLYRDNGREPRGKNDAMACLYSRHRWRILHSSITNSAVPYSFASSSVS